MRWRILALLVLARVGLGLQFQTTASGGGDLVAAFGLDQAGLGMLIGLFMASGLFLALPAGAAGRFASDRTLAGAGLAMLAAGGLVSGLAPSPEIVGLGRLLAGAGFLFSTLYLAKMVADWFEGREMATAMSLLVMSWPLGIAMGQVGHAWLAELHGWRLPYFAASAYCAAAAAAIWALYRAPVDRRAAAATAANRSTGLRGREWGLIVCAGIAWGAFNAGYVVYLGFAPAMLEAQGLSVLSAAGVISVGSWLMMFSGALCGMIADRFGRRDLILAVCMTAAVASLALLTTPGAGLAASLLFGLLGMAPAGVIMSLAGQAVAPERRAFGMGVFFTVYFAVMTAAPPLAGAIFDATGAPGGALTLGMILFAAVSPAAFAFRLLRSRARPALAG